MAGEGDFASIAWGVLPPDHLPASMDELVDSWIANQLQIEALPVEEALPEGRPHFWAWEAANYLAAEYPAKALAFIVALLARPVSDEIRYGLAAGPLEDLLACHGETVIDEVERLARQNAIFRDTLIGVWKNAMTDDTWERVNVARRTVPQT